MNPLRHWKLILGLTTVFVAGVVVGAALTAGAIHRKFKERANPDTWSPRTMAWFRDEVHVTPEQESQLRPIVDGSMRELLSLRNDADEKRRMILAALITEAAPILTDEQREAMREAIVRAKPDAQSWSLGGGKQR